MHLNSDGLIIKESFTGENDRIVTVLTREYGLVRAFAKGARTIKNRSQCATGLLCYSRLSIYCGRDANSVDDATPLGVFFGLRDNIEKLSLAQYFCELAGELAPENSDADEHLRLMLNLLHMLESGKRPQPLLKAVAELRFLCLAGYMPALLGCEECGKFEDEFMYFDRVGGVLRCPLHSPSGVAVGMGVLTAMRHICYSELDKLFSFTLPDDSLLRLSQITEGYLLAQIERKFKTLDFYKSIT